MLSHLAPLPSLPSPLCLMWGTGISMWLQVSWELWNLQSMLPEGLDACRCKNRREILRRNLSCNTCTTWLAATNATKCLNPALTGYVQEPSDLIWVPSLHDALSLHPILGHSIDAYQKYQLMGRPLWEAASPCPRLADSACLWHTVASQAALGGGTFRSKLTMAKCQQGPNSPHCPIRNPITSISISLSLA